MKRKSYLFIMLLGFALFCTGCGAQEQIVKENVISTPQITGNAKDELRDTLYWMLDNGYTETVENEVFERFNQLLAQKGYDFKVEFIGKDATEYEEYQNYINQAHKEKSKLDIFFTGYGVDGKADTYSSNVASNNLANLTNLLKTPCGKKIKKFFSDKMWKKMKENNKIYGIYNARELSSTYYLVLNKKYFKEKPALNSVDIKQWIKLAESVKYDEDEVGFYLPEEDKYEICGYEKNPLNDAYYSHNNRKKVLDVNKEKKVQELEQLIKIGTQKGWLNTNDDGLDFVYQGKFAMAVIDGYSNMVHGEKFVVDGKAFDAYVYPLSHKFIPIENNAATGITSWSKHKKQAFELLCAVNTDEELSNLLQYGILTSKDRGPDGYVTKELCSAQLSPSCPANQAITYPYAAEEQDKRAMYEAINKQYEFFPKE